MLGNKRKSGIGNYTRNLISNLRKIDGSNEYFLFFNEIAGRREGKFHHVKSVVNFESHPLSEIWANTCLPYKLFRKDVNVFHSPFLILPAWGTRCRLVITIYDMVVFKFPSLFPRKYSYFVKVMTTMALRRADKIIAISVSTKNDILEIFNIPEEKIEVIYGGADEVFRKIDDRDLIDSVQSKYSLDGPFILNVGTLEPRKNVARLIKAYEILQTRLTEKIKLVIAGGKGWLYDDIFKALSDSKVKDDIIILEKVEDSELPLLYNAASLFVYPALYEGFGLPVVEAMACGVPVVTSNVSSMPEIAEGAAVLVNPKNTVELADAMYETLMNGSLRDKLVKRGIERAGRFRWETTAKQTLEVYEAVEKSGKS